MAIVGGGAPLNLVSVGLTNAMAPSSIIPRFFRWTTLGIVIGFAGLLSARVWFYNSTGRATEMAPQIAYIFSPIIFALVLIIAFICEILVQRFVSRPHSRAEAFLVGASYVTLLVWWAFPGYAWLMVVFNPIVFRYLIISASKVSNRAA